MVLGPIETVCRNLHPNQTISYRTQGQSHKRKEWRRPGSSPDIFGAQFFPMRLTEIRAKRLKLGSYILHDFKGFFFLHPRWIQQLLRTSSTPKGKRTWYMWWLGDNKTWLAWLCLPDLGRLQGLCDSQSHGGNSKSKQLCLPPRKLTCPPNRDYFNRKYIFQPLVFRGHVSFSGSIFQNVGHNGKKGPFTYDWVPPRWENSWKLPCRKKSCHTCPWLVSQQMTLFLYSWFGWWLARLVLKYAFFRILGVVDRIRNWTETCIQS